MSPWDHNTESAAMSQPTWESVKWSDGTTYEGLVQDEKCHVQGVCTTPKGDRWALPAGSTLVQSDGSSLQLCTLGAGMRGNGVKISFRAWAFMCGRREAGGGCTRFYTLCCTLHVNWSVPADLAKACPASDTVQA